MNYFPTESKEQIATNIFTIQDEWDWQNGSTDEDAWHSPGDLMFGYVNP